MGSLKRRKVLFKGILRSMYQPIYVVTAEVDLIWAMGNSKTSWWGS